jgi:ribosomal protein S18 acetylase RimI-like enzyme
MGYPFPQGFAGSNPARSTNMFPATISISINNNYNQNGNGGMCKIRQLRRDENIPYDLLLLADETLEAINRYIFDCEIYVLEKENQIIAEYALLVLNDKEVEVKNIAVATEHQRRGIGKTLLKDATRRARYRCFKRVLMGTGDTSGMPLCFYLKVGFERYAVKKDFFVLNYPKPIYEGGVQLKDMVMLKKELK